MPNNFLIIFLPFLQTDVALWQKKYLMKIIRIEKVEKYFLGLHFSSPFQKMICSFAIF